MEFEDASLNEFPERQNGKREEQLDDAYLSHSDRHRVRVQLLVEGDEHSRLHRGHEAVDQIVTLAQDH